MLTLRNTGFAILTLIVAFIAITIRSELRRGPTEGDYGRLYRRQLPPPPETRTSPVEVVQEATPPADPDEVSAPPMLVAPPPPTPVTLDTRDGNARIAIVGGPAGVTAIDNAPRREEKKLKGGIFRSGE